MVAAIGGLPPTPLLGIFSGWKRAMTPQQGCIRLVPKTLRAANAIAPAPSRPSSTAPPACPLRASRCASGRSACAKRKRSMTRHTLQAWSRRVERQLCTCCDRQTVHVL
eukprot:5837650-Pleurochrysis_carterae.AAC.1